MNTTSWIESLIASKTTAAMPIMTHPGIELTGHTVLDAVTRGELHFQAIKALSKRFPQAAACTVIMDLTVEAEAFGASILFSDNEVPCVTGRLVSNRDACSALYIPSLDAGRIPEYLKANLLAATQLDKPVFSGCIGPFSLAGRLFDLTEIMLAIYTEPKTAQILLEKCTQFLLHYCQALKQTGTAGIILAEPAAGLLSNADCMLYSSTYIRQIVDAVQDDNFAVILHNCGNTGHCTEAMTATGAKCYHFGNKIDLKNALQSCPENALVMGNLDPVGIFRNGSVQEVESATRGLLEKCADHPNFVISSGCDIPPQTPLSNIEAFYRTVDAFNANK